MRLLACVLAFALPHTAIAADLSGRWEAQTMGADREIVIQQRGKKLIAHRVMWPEFEGERYKLEHLYRGTIAGERITGDLLVREEGQRDYELLRTFAGELGARGLKLDGMGLRRIESATEASESAASRAAPAAPDAPVAAPAAAIAAAPAGSVPAASPPTVAPAPAADAAASAGDPGATLFANIMGAPGSDNLFRVSAAVTMPDDAARLIAAGDALARKKKHAAALAKYEEAAALGESVTLLHRMGRCQLALGRYPQARALLGRALRLDPQSAQLERDYARAKQHE